MRVNTYPPPWQGGGQRGSLTRYTLAGRRFCQLDADSLSSAVEGFVLVFWVRTSGTRHLKSGFRVVAVHERTSRWNLPPH